MTYRITCLRTTGSEPGKEAGFTLVEMLVALVITGMILLMVGGILQSTMNARQRVRSVLRKTGTGPAIVQLLKRDLSTAVVFGEIQSGRTYFLGENQQRSGRRTDSVDFVRTGGAWKSEQGRFSRLSECGYQLKPNPEEDGGYRLFRRSSPGVQGNPVRGGNLVKVSDRVVSLQFDYKKTGTKKNEQDERPLNKWLSSWNDSEKPFKGKKPDLIRVILKLRPRPGTEENQGDVRTYRTIVNVF